MVFDTLQMTRLKFLYSVRKIKFHQKLANSVRVLGEHGALTGVTDGRDWVWEELRGWCGPGGNGKGGASCEGPEKQVSGEGFHQEPCPL